MATIPEARLWSSSSHIGRKRQLDNVFSSRYIDNTRESCATDGSGKYGAISSHLLSIFYSYQMTVMESAETPDLSAAIQNEMISSLLPIYFIECSGTGRRIERHKHGHDEIIGIGASPVSIEKDICESRFTRGTKCVEMEGHLLFYINDKFNQEQIDTQDIVAATKLSVQKAMKDSHPYSIHSDLISLDFRGIALDSFAATSALSLDENSSSRTVEREQLNESAFGLGLMLVCAAVFIGILKQRRSTDTQEK